MASRIANYIADNEEFPKEGDKELLKARKLYVNKIFKHIGLYEKEVGIYKSLALSY